MYNNILTYVCFFILCGLLVLDMVFYSSVALQIVCILLVCVVVGLGTFLAYKHHKGTYISNEQQNNLHSYLSENITLQNELQTLKTKQAKSKINSTEVQQLITFNARLTHQITNLKTRVEQLTELLQNAKNQGTTVVLPITPNEQTPPKPSKKIAASALASCNISVGAIA
jgi:ABC-type bacteriocin/lantibiotic exporter with double-glycine peptidase domain